MIRVHMLEKKTKVSAPILINKFNALRRGDRGSCPETVRRDQHSGHTVVKHQHLNIEGTFTKTAHTFRKEVARRWWDVSFMKTGE